MHLLVEVMSVFMCLKNNMEINLLKPTLKKKKTIMAKCLIFVHFFFIKLPWNFPTPLWHAHSLTFTHLKCVHKCSYTEDADPFVYCVTVVVEPAKLHHRHLAFHPLLLHWRRRRRLIPNPPSPSMHHDGTNIPIEILVITSWPSH